MNYREPLTKNEIREHVAKIQPFVSAHNSLGKFFNVLIDFFDIHQGM